MRPKSLILLCLALGCGLVASIGISQVMDRNKQPGSDMQEIVVVIADIKPYDPLKPDTNIKMESWPKEKIPANAITNLQDIAEARAKTNFYVGEVVIMPKILKKGEYMDVDLPKGYRSVAVPVDDASAAGQLLRPGSRVDVMVFVNKAQNPDVRQTGTFTIIKDIQIFAVDQTVRKVGDKVDEAVKAKTISLVVTAEQAQIVMTADQIGKLRFILRNQNEPETGTDALKVVKIDDILMLKRGKDGRSPDNGGDDFAPTPPPAEKVAAAPTVPSTTESVLDFINKMRSSGANASSTPGEHRTQNFTMQVLNGPEEKKVEFSRSAVAGAAWKQGTPSMVPPIDSSTAEPSLPSISAPTTGGGIPDLKDNPSQLRSLPGGKS